jgi:transposase-like protein
MIAKEPWIMESKAKREPLQYTAEQKCQAVLSVWGERRKVKEICRELSIQPMVFTKWQERAMEGMLRALEPRGMKEELKPALSTRLQKLLLRKVVQREGKMAKLRQRLPEGAAGKGD